MYLDSQTDGRGVRALGNQVQSVTELHLDAGSAQDTGGHVIVNPHGNTAENRAFVATLRNYSGIWAAMKPTHGLSYRSDLLNLRVLQRRAIAYRLVELGFITNAEDLQRLQNNADQLAKSLLENATGEEIAPRS